MRFQTTRLGGAWIVDTDQHADDRGYFARLRCSEEFDAHGLPATFVQTNLSYNRIAGTFRGLHYSVPPSTEGKLVRCVSGAIDDVIVDLRPDSPTFLQHEWVRLSGRNAVALFVPSGFAHGFLTATDETLVLYEMTDAYAPDLSAGIRWSDPLLDLQLPGEIRMIHDRDANYPDVDAKRLDVFSVG